jgi:hypothetical protein
VPEEHKSRVEEAMKESVVMATKGRRYVDHVKTRLKFDSKDSESSSYKGATGAAPGRWQTAAEELGEELGEVFEEESDSEDEGKRSPWDELRRPAGLHERLRAYAGQR